MVFTYDEILHELEVAIDDAMWDEVRLATMGLSTAAKVVKRRGFGGAGDRLTGLAQSVDSSRSQMRRRRIRCSTTRRALTKFWRPSSPRCSRTAATVASSTDATSIT